MGSKLTDLDDLAPSDDFALNAFLLELNDDLTDEDLEKLKFLCTGEKIRCPRILILFEIHMN